MEVDSTGAGAIYRQFLFSTYKSKSSPISPSRERIMHSLVALTTSGLKAAIPLVSILAVHENIILSRNHGIANVQCLTGEHRRDQDLPCLRSMLASAISHRSPY
jgi:hypothetical protein